MDENKDKSPLFALSDYSWINTPVNYTTYTKKFSLLQQDVLLIVSGKLQEHFTRYLNEHRYLRNEHPKSGIAKEDLLDLEPITIPLAELGIDSAHYDRAVAAVSELEHITFHLPRFDNETGLRKGDDYMPIFSKIFVPKDFVSEEGSDYAYTGNEIKVDEKGEKQSKFRRAGCIEVTINIEAAKAIFDMDQGYFNHLERIAYFCTSAYTSRLYFALMKFVSKGQMSPTIDYVDLKELLGMYERADRSDTIINEKYKKFAQFRTQVLNVARRDMERLNNENKIEIVLDSSEPHPDGYEPIYKGTAKRGNPERIRFYILRTPLGLARENELHRSSSEQRVCKKIMELYPTLDKGKIKNFVSSVPSELWGDFKRYVYKGLQKAVDQPHRWDGTPESFVYYILEAWVKFRTKKNPPVPPQQTNMAAIAAPVVPEPVEEDYPGKYATEWANVVGEYNGTLKQYLIKARHYGASPAGFMSIRFADKKTLDEFNALCEKEKNEYDRFMRMLADKIGRNAARVLVRGIEE